MRRKRLQHHTDIFCDMFVGWRMANDLDKLTELKSGILEFDFINKTQILNGIESLIDFNMFYEISGWFIEDLEKHNIDIKEIKKATLKVKFDVEIILGKTKSKTKSTTELSFIMKAKILTDEKEYHTDKKDKQIYKFVEKK
ncbi:hypothetical protein SAMN04487910_2749 [Aquimarina amphilecti]|uniref:Uncharacterized protein n=1 Tax=Aquimarina amphilecti TaxID=1038014 RepID=A0A1H7R121_AQUAM|nr:hypothetical protein [Aquimarina amphilecti]SEL53624.1 hypothetical protein SAMN04487910_2749 [Aquimarina amphilecti]